MAVKFQVRDEVITNADNHYHGSEDGMITDIRFQDDKPIYIVKIDDKQHPFHEEELDFKYSFTKSELWAALDDVYGSNNYTMSGRFATELKDIGGMSAAQVKNKFGSLILDQLLLNRSDEA